MPSQFGVILSKRTPNQAQLKETINRIPSFKKKII